MTAHGAVGTVRDVTLRDDVRGLLAESGGSGVADLGIADLPAELVGTVLTHFADTASIGDADVLSPLVMRSSHVPFDAELDGVSQEAVDPLGELLAIGESGNDDAFDDGDPSVIDGVDGSRDVVDDVAEEVVGADDDFGAGAEGAVPETDELAPADSATLPDDGIGYIAAPDDVDPMGSGFDDDSVGALEAPIDLDVDEQDSDIGLDDLFD